MIYTPNPPQSAIHRQARALELGRAEPTGDAIIAEAGKGDTKNYCRKRKACLVPKPSQDTREWRQANHDGECVQNLRSDLRGNPGRPRELENKPNQHGRVKAWRKPRSYRGGG